jgi:methyl-accepting chemotaxis protein
VLLQHVPPWSITNNASPRAESVNSSTAIAQPENDLMSVLIGRTTSVFTENGAVSVSVTETFDPQAEADIQTIVRVLDRFTARVRALSDQLAPTTSSRGDIPMDQRITDALGRLGTAITEEGTQLKQMADALRADADPIEIANQLDAHAARIAALSDNLNDPTAEPTIPPAVPTL